MKRIRRQRNVFMILVLITLGVFIATVVIGILVDVFLNFTKVNNTLFIGIVEVAVFILVVIKVLKKISKEAIYK